MRGKKLFTIALAAMTACSIMAGCGGGVPEENSGKSSQGTGTGTVTDGSNPSTLEPYEIQWAYVGDSYPDVDKVEGKINEILQPKFNCTVNLVPMSWGEFVQKLNLMLSGDEQLDLCL